MEKNFSVRIIICTPFFYLLCNDKPKFSIIKNNFPPLICLSLLLVFIPNIFMAAGIKYANGAAASFVEALEPIITGILAGIFLKERIKPNYCLGLLFAIAGSYSFASQGFSINPFAHSSLIGIGLVFVSACSFSGSTIMGKKLLEQYLPTEILFYTFFLSSLIMIPVSLSLFIGQSYHILHDYSVIYAILGLSFISSVGGYLLYFIALSKLKAQVLSCYLFAIPIITTIYSYVFLDTRPQPFVYTSGVLILTGLIIFEFFDFNKIYNFYDFIRHKKKEGF